MAHLPSETAALPIQVGDVVRVTIGRGRACPDYPHFDGESGRTGRIVGIGAITGAPSHPYLVVLDPGPAHEYLVDWRLAVQARHYAADELVRLTA